ncbi:MAG: hypothetical protein PHC34_02370 [Candidatus Gastranaerophilales bacterium]|nr:hypothetical protein [Candidatus Gastranaerophilales bacterium]
MNKFIIIFTLIILSGFFNKAEAFCNPFNYIHFMETSSKNSNEYIQVKDTLDRMISAYESRNTISFMKYVSDDYTHDEDVLETGIRNSFYRYSFIRINYVINNVISDSNGKYSVSINFTKQLEDRTKGKITSKSGTSELILKIENDSLKLYSMRRQHLF